MKIKITSITFLVILIILLPGIALLQSCNKKSTSTPGPKPPVVLPGPRNYIVSTLAGNTEPGYVDGPGSVARFSNPNGIAIDALGNLCVTDDSNYIRGVTPSGMVTTRGPNALSPLQFILPSGVAVDADGDIYVADTYNHRICKVALIGNTVTTFAGGIQGFKDGNGTDAKFAYPNAIALDASGNVYVSDSENNSIRKITPGGQVTTLAGNGNFGFVNGTGATAEFAGPNGLALDAGGNIYVADLLNHAIRKITPAGLVSTLTGNGSPGLIDGSISDARFFGPQGVATDATGNVYVADTENHRIRMISTGGIVTTLAGGDAGFTDGPGATARFNSPRGLVVDALGNIFVTDLDNNRIRQLKMIKQSYGSVAIRLKKGAR